MTFPQSLQMLRASYNTLPCFPNVSSQRFPALKWLYINNNDITNVSHAALAGMSGTVTQLQLYNNQLVHLGDATVLTNLNALQLHGNDLETIPDMLGGLPRLSTLRIKDNVRMACDHRMCWRRLWDRVRSPIKYSDDVKCMAPPAARGHLLSLISPGFIECDQGEGWYYWHAFRKYDGNSLCPMAYGETEYMYKSCFV